MKDKAFNDHYTSLTINLLKSKKMMGFVAKKKYKKEDTRHVTINRERDVVTQAINQRSRSEDVV